MKHKGEERMSKPKYEVGDYVRIKSDLKVDYDKGLVPEMVDMAGQLVQISDVDSHSMDDLIYNIKELENYWWSEDWFEYRLGNYEDNNFEHSRVKYVIGYKDLGTSKRFEGYIEKFCPTNKSLFIDENGKILVLPYKKIEYILPKENKND